MAAFDVAVAIEEFLSDSERTSLELPHMTTGQRKNTKKFLESYPQLQCESYGFAAERKLVLFKQGSQPTLKKASTEASEVVNSVESNVTAAAKPGETTPGCDRAPALSPPRRHQVHSLQGSPATSLPDTFEELQVRNTFIHFEGLTQTDERAVQSMPHGMFKQCCLAEALQGGCDSPSTRSGYDTPDTPTSVYERESLMDAITADPSTGASQTPSQLSLGALVIVEGLTKAPAFNGCSAVIQSWDEEAKRYNILLAAPGGCQQAKIKQENLRAVMPCP